tara:strand:- start:1977 stop:2396 length:420 start_codon:yes stop_codon:yes gene_type:complete
MITRTNERRTIERNENSILVLAYKEPIPSKGYKKHEISKIEGDDTRTRLQLLRGLRHIREANSTYPKICPTFEMLKNMDLEESGIDVIYGAKVWYDKMQSARLPTVSMRTKLQNALDTAIISGTGINLRVGNRLRGPAR